MKEIKIQTSRMLINKYLNVRYIAVIARNFENEKNNMNLEVEKSKLQREIRKDIKDPSKLGRLEKDGIFFKRFGKNSPIEYQLKSIIDGKDIPTDSTLKDPMFMTEMKHHFIMSAQDLDKIKGDLEFDLSKGGEIYTKINGKEQKLKPDDIILKQDDEILASHLYGPDFSTRVTENTKNCLYLLWFDSEITDNELKIIVNDLKRYLKIISNENSKIEVFGVKEKPLTEIVGKSYVVTPWEVKGNIDYDKLIKDFGVKPLDKKLLQRIKKHTGELHHFLRRGIFFSHMYFDNVLDELEKGNKFYLYTGRAPSGPVHLGHVVPWIFTKWIQEKFDVPLLFQIPDEEKFLFKDDLTLEDTKKWAYENILDIIAVGFDPKKTKIFLDTEYAKTMYKLACQVAKKITFSTVKATFGLQNSNNIGEIFYTSMQSVPALLPTIFEGKATRAVIPCAIDQDVHFRLTRDVVESLGYPKPSTILSRFLPGLGGMLEEGKMSSSVESTCVFTTDTPEQVRKKIMKHAFSGGARNVEEHRKFGGNPDIDVSYQWLTFFEESDQKLKKIHDDYKSGALLTGELKQILIDKLNGFLKEFQERREKAKDRLDDFIVRD